MNRFFRCFIVLSLLCMPVLVYALEDTCDDFENGNNWGGTRWYGQGGGDAWSAPYATTTLYKHGPLGKSMRLLWGNVDAADEWAGGGIDSMDVDVSTYNALSFWIYTHESGYDILIELNDGTNGGKVNLQDYLTSGTSVWQEVSIPLADFERAEPLLDLTTVAKVNFLSDYNAGHFETSGNMHLDDIRFTIQPHAPARTHIYSGGNGDGDDDADMPGETLMWWNEAVSTATTNEVTVKISTGYAVSWQSTPSDETGDANTTKYVAYQMRNDGNRADNVSLSTQVIDGNSWTSTIYWDVNANGVYDEGTDTDTWNAIGTLPSSTFYFLLGVAIPGGAVDGDSTTIRVTAKDNDGSGAEDDWPTVSSGDDTITDDVIVTCVSYGLLANYNPSFESAVEFEYWEEEPVSASTDYDLAFGHWGAQSCLFQNPTYDNTGRGVKTATRTVTGLNEYDVSAWFYVHQDTDTYTIDKSELFLQVIWIDNSDVVISTVGLSAQNLSAFDTWEKISATGLVAPANAVKARVYISCQDADTFNTDNDVSVDDVAMIDQGAAALPIMSIVKSTDTATAQPGDTITYTLTYENTGTGAANSVQIIDTIPTNTQLNAAVTVYDGETVNYYVGSSWQGSYDAAATKIRVTRASLGAASGAKTVDIEVKVK